VNPQSKATTISASASATLGVLVIGRKRPGFDMEWNQIMRQRTAEALADLHLKSIGAEMVDDETITAALQKIRQAGCESLLVLQPSLGNGQLAFTVMQQWAGPVVLWATPERGDGDKVSSCSLVAQHLWASIFRHSNRPFEFVNGDPQDPSVRDSLRNALLVSRTAAVLKRTKVGLVGSHAPGFIPMHADPFLLQTALGVQLQNLSLPQFIDRVHAIDEARVIEDLAKSRALRFASNNITEGELKLDSRYYLAMKDLIGEEKLDALALQCWPELSAIQWPYLALTRLNNDGYVASMEGDVDGVLTCLLGKELNAGVGFITDWLAHDRKTITFWHPGVAPLDLCEPVGSRHGASLAKHFNIAKPLVVDAMLKPDVPVTIARLWRCDGRYHLTALQGRTIAPRRHLTGNAGTVEVDSVDVVDWFDDALHAGLPHHVIVFAGRHAENFRRLARMLMIHWWCA
jgi:L-fucose isomerase-like protein